MSELTPTSIAMPQAAPFAGSDAIPHLGGLVPMVSVAQMQAQERRDAEVQNAQPLIAGIAAHVRTVWTTNRMAKMQTVQDRMLKAIRQRRGEYDPDDLAEIRKQGGSEVYMMLTSNKCRAAASWIRDVMLGTGADKPWSMSPTALPDLSPAVQESIDRTAQAQAAEFAQAAGIDVSQVEVEAARAFLYDRVVANAQKSAKETAARMEAKMEDQLQAGGFRRALGEFIEDLVTFPSAILEGPIIRKKPKLVWTQAPDGTYTLDTSDQIVVEWERVDPMMVYPSPGATDIDDGELIIRRKLSRSGLNAMRGVDGYSDGAINSVLDEYGRGGLSEWLWEDTAKASVEGKSVAAIMQNPDGLIDALQYWGSIQGKKLIEWGMDKEQVPDPLKDYPCEAWLIGRWVIKATLNSDPLGRKNYYKASYEEIPGAFWGNAVTDLCRDVQKECNVAARAIANNMGLASGPMLDINVDRMPPGEDISAIYPWRIHQSISDPYGSSAPAVQFYQPRSIAGELMQIYEFFSRLADEHTGVPRYMAGDAAGSGALRTSSGMSMLMNNAGKAIKHVIANVDRALEELLQRLFFHNMKYSNDPELKGDASIVVRGAESLVVKESAQQRINEFLQMALNSPVVLKIVGEEAVAEMLRAGAKQLNLDVDSVVPPPEVIRNRIAQQAQQAAAAQKAQQDFQMQMSLAPSHEVEMERGPNGEMVGMKIIDKQPHVMSLPGVVPPQDGMPGGSPMRTMTNANRYTGGDPVTNHFSPMRSH